MEGRNRILRYQNQIIKISGKRGRYSCVEVLAGGWYWIRPRDTDGRLKTLAEKLRLAKNVIDGYLSERGYNMSQLNRKVHIEGVEWKYMVGKKHAVIHVPHLDKKVTVALELLVDKDQREIDKGRKQGSTDGMILPSEIEKYIRKNLIA